MAPAPRGGRTAVLLGLLAGLAACAAPADDTAAAAEGTGIADIDPTTLPQGSQACRAPVLAQVLRELDGDTVDVRVGEAEERVRFIGVNAPEIAHGSDPADCYGPEAADYTASLLPPGAWLWLTFDRDCEDDYGRTLAYLHTDSSETGFVERLLLRGGYARTMTFEATSTFEQAFAEDEQRARDEDAGLWGACR